MPSFSVLTVYSSTDMWSLGVSSCLDTQRTAICGQIHSSFCIIMDLTVPQCLGNILIPFIWLVLSKNTGPRANFCYIFSPDFQLHALNVLNHPNLLLLRCDE